MFVSQMFFFLAVALVLKNKIHPVIANETGLPFIYFIQTARFTIELISWTRHQSAYKQIVEKCIAEAILPQWIISFCAVYIITLLPSRCCAVCGGWHQELNYWSIFYDFYESLEQKNTKWVIGFQRSVFKRLMFGHSITSIIRKIFDKSILLPSGIPIWRTNTYWIFKKTYKIYGHYPFKVSKGAFL